jgi:hypothetical protein
MEPGFKFVMPGLVPAMTIAKSFSGAHWYAVSQPQSVAGTGGPGYTARARL